MKKRLIFISAVLALISFAAHSAPVIQDAGSVKDDSRVVVKTGIEVLRERNFAGLEGKRVEIGGVGMELIPADFDTFRPFST